MGQGTYDVWMVIFQGITAIGLVYFAWRQTQINKRTQELADYVAVSIVPKGPVLQIMNVGRVNLYIHKWEIGSATETYVRPLLIPTDAKSSVVIALQPPQFGQHLAKIYLTDDSDRKYLSTGEVVVEPVGFQASTVMPQVSPEPGSEPQLPSPVTITFQMRAWSYKTERYNWTI